MKVRVTFKYKGTIQRRYTEATVDCEVEGAQLAFQTEEQSLMSEAEEELSCMVTGGLIDVPCTHAVDNFYVVSVTKDIPDEKADYIY